MVGSGLQTVDSGLVDGGQLMVGSGWCYYI